MSNSYKLSVNQTTTFDWNESDLKTLDAIQLNSSQFHVLDSNKSYKVEIVSADFIAKKYILSFVKKVVNKKQNDWNELFYDQKIFHYLIYLTPAPILYLGSFLFPFFQSKIEKVVLVYIALIFILLAEKILSTFLLIYKANLDSNFKYIK